MLWRYRKWAVYTTATNDEPPEQPENSTSLPQIPALISMPNRVPVVTCSL